MAEKKEACDACWPNATVIGEALPGYWLFRHDGDNQAKLPVGTYALHSGYPCDALCYTLPCRPVLSPWHGYTDAEIDSWPDDDPRIKAEGVHQELVDAIGESLHGRPEAGYALIQACLEAGWKWENSGMVQYWLVERLARLIDAYEAEGGN